MPGVTVNECVLNVVRLLRSLLRASTPKDSEMTDETAASNSERANKLSGMNRREAVKRGAMVTGAVGAAWTAPMVYDSFATPAAAAGTEVLKVDGNLTTTVASSITIPDGRKVEFWVTGGGGGGGAFYTYCGGSGTTLQGVIPGQSGYLLSYSVGGGGGGGFAYTSAGTQAKGGAGYRLGGSSGVAAATGPGSGGAGGGASGISGGGIEVIAPGGGGSGAGGNLSWPGSAGGQRPNAVSGTVSGTLAGNPGANGSGNYPGRGGAGGTTSGTAAGGTKNGSNSEAGYAGVINKTAPSTGSNGGYGGSGGGGAGAGGGGYIGGGGGSGGDGSAGAGAGGSGSAQASGTFLAGVTASVADSSPAGTTSGVQSGPGHCGPGVGDNRNAPAGNGGAGGNGQIRLVYA